jgi:argininosuccinate synthase
MNEQLNKEQKSIVNVKMFEGMETGFEDTNQETFKTPFLKILQQLSPELKKTGPNYTEGAEEGMLFNSATKQLYKELKVIIVKISHDLVAWKPERGGFVGIYPKSKENEIVVKQRGVRKYDKDGNDVNDTISFFCVNVEDPSDIFIFPLSTAMLKHAKSLCTRIRMLKQNGSPVHVSYAGVWKFKTIEESNDKGDWFTIGNVTEFERFITMDELTNYVKPALELLKKAETDYTQMDNGKEDDSSNDPLF